MKHRYQRTKGKSNGSTPLTTSWFDSAHHQGEVRRGAGSRAGSAMARPRLRRHSGLAMLLSKPSQVLVDVKGVSQPSERRRASESHF